jgi:16S rRNA G527 N7-methylase RsmG
VTFKGSRVDQEIEDSKRLMGELDLRISKKIPYSLPETEGKRYILILEKGRT